MGGPEFRCLPVHGTNEALDHRTGRLLNLCEAKVGNLRCASGSDKDVGRFAVTMDDGRVPGMKVLETASNVQHHAQLRYCQFISVSGGLQGDLRLCAGTGYW